MTYKLKSEKPAKKFIYKNLRRTNFWCNLLYVNSEGISENFKELFISIFFYIYKGMGQKQPLIKVNVSLKEL